MRLHFHYFIFSCLFLYGFNFSIAHAARNNSDANQYLTIHGQVTDTAGLPLTDVRVDIDRRNRAMTNQGGMFSLDQVYKRRQIPVKFSKQGYVDGYEVLHLDKNYSCFRQAQSSFRRHADFLQYVNGLRQCRVQPQRQGLTLTKTLLAVAMVRQLDAQAGGTVALDGFSLHIPADSLQAQGMVDVMLTPVNVRGEELLTAPGYWQKGDKRNSNQRFDVSAAVHISITQNGKTVRLKRYARIGVELVLPDDTRLTTGESIQLGWYHPQRGAWRMDQQAGIIDSTQLQGRMAVSAQLQRLGWWSAQQKMSEQNCLSGVVENSDGSRVAGAEVRAVGVELSTIIRTNTNQDGEYCLPVQPGSTVDIQASAQVAGNLLHSEMLTVLSDRRYADCTRGNCEVAPVLSLPGLACISGNVRNEAAAPLRGVTIASSSGATALTNEAGEYCMPVPAGTGISVAALDYPAVSLRTSAAGGNCADGDCDVVDLTPNVVVAEPQPEPPPVLAQTCVTGYVSHFYGFPLPDVALQTVSAVDGAVLAAPVVTDGAGIFVIDNVPAETEVIISGVDNAAGCSVSTQINTDAAGGSVTSGSCFELGGLICQ